MSDVQEYRRRVLLVANPVSGRGAVERHLGAVKDRVNAWSGTLQVVETDQPGDARRAAKQFGGGLILSFGGDGTFNEVLNGCDLNRCVLGVIPAGTGNVLANELGMPLDPERAVDALALGRVYPMDCGICNDQRFACVCGAGMDAAIVRTVHERREDHLTQLHYIPILLRESLTPTQWGIQVEVDGECLCHNANIVCVGNTRSYGGPIQVTSAASPVDGRLDVVATCVGSVVGMLQPSIAALLRGFHTTGSAVYGRGKTVKLTSSRDDVPWEIDGDFGGTLPGVVRVLPGTMRILAPRRLRF